MTDTGVEAHSDRIEPYMHEKIENELYKFIIRTPDRRSFCRPFRSFL